MLLPLPPQFPVESLEFAREVLRHSPDCIKILDAEGRLVWMNDRGLEVMEVCDPTLLMGATWRDFWEGPNTALVEGALEAARAGHPGRFRGTCRTCAGTLKWWDVIVTVFPSPPGEPTVFMCVSRDITEMMMLAQERDALVARERESRDKAERLARERKRVLLEVSHELRAPLNAVQGWAAFLDSGAPQPEIHQAVLAIGRNAGRLSALVEQLVDAAYYSTTSPPIPVPNPVNHLVTAAVEGIAPAARAKGIDVGVSVHPDDWVMADSGAVQQALTNLLTNAVKFTPEGGRIEILAAAASDRIRIAVIDDGLGIAADFLPYVFEPFRQAANQTSRQPGLGLGLSITRNIVEAHGGAVEASSPGPGRGSTFALYLPKAEPAFAVR